MLFANPVVNAARALERPDVRIKFVSDAEHASDVVRYLRCKPEFAPEVADVIADCPAGIVIQIFMPYKVVDHVINNRSSRIYDEQGKDIKLFCERIADSFSPICSPDSDISSAIIFP